MFHTAEDNFRPEPGPDTGGWRVGIPRKASRAPLGVCGVCCVASPNGVGCVREKAWVLRKEQVEEVLTRAEWAAQRMAKSGDGSCNHFSQRDPVLPGSRRISGGQGGLAGESQAAKLPRGSPKTLIQEESV